MRRKHIHTHAGPTGRGQCGEDVCCVSTKLGVQRWETGKWLVNEWEVFLFFVFLAHAITCHSRRNGGTKRPRVHPSHYPPVNQLGGARNWNNMLTKPKTTWLALCGFKVAHPTAECPLLAPKPTSQTCFPWVSYSPPSLSTSLHLPCFLPSPSPSSIVWCETGDLE